MNAKRVYYHFTSSTLRNGRPVPPAGTWLIHYGERVMCESGLHASLCPLDAMKYAPGHMLHKVLLGGETTADSDKVCAERRMIIETRNAERAMRRFAKSVALSVSHLWDAPQAVLDYLASDSEDPVGEARGATGGSPEGLGSLNQAQAEGRLAAWGLAWGAMWHAPWQAARLAAWAAAGPAWWSDDNRAMWHAAAAAKWETGQDVSWREARGEFSLLIDDLFMETVD